MRIIKKLIRVLIIKDKISEKYLKYLPKNWIDEKGENLFHYAAYYHNEQLFNKALQNEANINQKNHRNFLPIHTLIECSFVTGVIPNKSFLIWLKDYGLLLVEWLKEKLSQEEEITLQNYIQSVSDERLSIIKEKENITLDPNISLVKLFIDNGADINAFCREDGFSYDLKSHLGSPIGLLIELFIRAILTPNYSNLTVLNKYEQLYELLSISGANINVLRQTGYFGEKDIIVDAMQITNSINLSNFFIRNMKDNKYSYAIIPLLSDPKIDYQIQDEIGNTILHTLIGKLINRDYLFEKDTLHEILSAVINNPSFKKEYLEIKNNVKISPIDIINRGTIDSKEIFDMYLLKISLDTILPQKTNTIKKTKKI